VRFLTAPDFANKLPNLFFNLHLAFLVHTYLILFQKLSEKSNSKKIGGFSDGSNQGDEGVPDASGLHRIPGAAPMERIARMPAL